MSAVAIAAIGTYPTSSKSCAPQRDETHRRNNDVLYLSWNVNGIRSCLSKGFEESMAAVAPDAVCLQEVRALPEQVDIDLPGYRQYWHPADKKGYSGVAILSKREPLDEFVGMGVPELEGEGRVLTLEFDDHYLVTVYTPNAQRGLARLPHRMRWDAEFLAYMQRLEQTKPVIACGDLNVSHKPIDLANPKNNEKNAGYSPQERAGFQAFMDAGFLDTFRLFEDGPGHYSWWSWRVNARARNIGWRLDYFLASAALRGRIAGAGILADVFGSDHCPVTLQLK